MSEGVIHQVIGELYMLNKRILIMQHICVLNQALDSVLFKKHRSVHTNETKIPSSTELKATTQTVVGLSS